MAGKQYAVAVFNDVEPAVKALDHLREIGVKDEQVEIISGIPLSHEVLGRKQVSTFIPKLALGGAIAGWIIAMFLMFGTPFLFSLHVGGQPLYPVPPFYIVAFELTMLGLMGTAFIGLFVAGRFPTYEPKVYVPEVSDGKIALVFPSSKIDQRSYEDDLRDLGAEQVRGLEEETI